MTGPDPGRVLRRALLAWGWGHLLLGRTAIGRALLVAELGSIVLLAWLTVGLADTSAYLVPFLAGIVVLLAWAWQAVAAYRGAQASQPAHPAEPQTPERSPATAIGWLSIPLLAWGAGFWLIGAHAATPAATLDRFVSAWTAGELEADEWPPSVIEAASEAEDSLGTGPDRFQDVRFSIVEKSADDALALGESVHFERQETTMLLIFSGSELVPVADEQLLSLELAALPVELPGGGDVGAVRWELVDATSP